MAISFALLAAASHLAVPASACAQARVPSADSVAPSPHPGSYLAVGLSAAIPGAGQLLVLHQRRGWAYVAAEALAWTVWTHRRAEARDFRNRYRDLAWEAARLWQGPRVDGDFGYYERLTSWNRSGVFDGDPGSPGVQPEADPGTFNGFIWGRARGIYSVGEGQGPGDPAYDAALAYYLRNAYGEPFLWDWGPNSEDRARYDGLIRDSDERFRQATIVLGIVFANHLISAVDAFIATRGVSVRLAPESVGSWGRAQVLVRWEP